MLIMFSQCDGILVFFLLPNIMLFHITYFLKFTFLTKGFLLSLVRKNTIIKLLWLWKSHSWASHNTGDFLLKHNLYGFQMFSEPISEA